MKLRSNLLEACLFSAALLWGAGQLAAAPLQVVKEGKSPYCIVVAPDNPGPAAFAARDLQTYIQKATGARLPILKPEKRGSRPAFMIGFDKVTEPEGFRVRTAGNDIYISGNDTKGDVLNNHWANGARTGSWHGVCDFLEKQLGIRWFMPGELGEYVPKRSNWTVPELDYHDAPRFDHRRLNYQTRPGMSKKQAQENHYFGRRNRSGNANVWLASHSWLHHLPKSKYFKDHPEYFALVGGRRLGTDALNHGLQICTTNPEALDQLAANLIDYAKRFKKPIMLTLTPNDGGNMCECARCQALDDGIRPDGSRIMTTRIITYANEMAKRITKVNPDQKLGLYAYSHYAESVSKVKAHPAVSMMEVLNDSGLSYYRSETRTRHLKNLKGWRRVLAKLYFYTFPEGMGGLELPCCQFRNISMLYDNLYASDVTGIDINNTSSYGAAALNNYFYLKYAWGGIKDRAKFYDETLRDCYGPAGAPVMKAYFADIENRLERFANTKLDEDLSLGYIKRYPGVLTRVYPGLAEKWLPQLKAAAAKTADPGQRARIGVAVANLEYCQATVKLYALASKVVGTPRPDVKIVAEALKLTRERDALLKKMGPLPSNTAPKLTKTENVYRLPFDPNVFAFMMAANARKSAAVTPVAAAPVMDGKVDDAVWSQAKGLRIELAKDNAETMKTGADLRLLRYKDDLYIGIRCEEPLMKNIADSCRGPESKVWDENCLDFFFVPEKGKVYQIVFNTLGTVRTFRKDIPKAVWKPHAEIKTFRGADFWSAEVKIPIADLTGPREYLGDVWGANFCRVRRTVHPSEYTCWSPTFGDFSRPERFGRIIIK